MTAIHPALTVAQIVSRVPRAGSAFIARGMACVGCAMAPFHTLCDTAATYGLDLAALLAELKRLAGAPGEGHPPERPGPAVGHSGGATKRTRHCGQSARVAAAQAISKEGIWTRSPR